MRILVTGSRNWTNDVLICDVLWDTIKKGPDLIHDNVLVSGACPEGADSMAEYWADTWGLTIERHPAKWHQYGMAAGQIRNKEMVDLGANICLAFIMECSKSDCKEPKPHDSHGAGKCAQWAEEAGIRTQIYRG